MRDETLQSFGEKELIDLILGIVLINGWNGLAISFRTPQETTRRRSEVIIGTIS